MPRPFDTSSAVAHLPVGIVAVKDGHIWWANEHANGLLAGGRDLTGAPIVGFFQDDYEKKTLRELLLIGSGRCEVSVSRESEATLSLLVDVSSALDPGGDYSIVLLTDLSELKREHYALEKAAEVIELRLEQELQRKREELERARSLQLAMVPTSLPEVPGFELEAQMRTASEVGGDYYDVAWVDESGLLAVLGDATGHGLDAGMMVTATKATLSMIPTEYSPGDLLLQLNASLRRLALPKMYMSLAAFSISGESMRVSAAGMPPLYIFRAATGKVDNVVIKSPPLAGFPWFDYAEKSLDLDSGDTVLLLTDGFCERFDKDKNMLGFDGAIPVLLDCGNEPLKVIVDSLVETSDSWGKGRPLDDDETFFLVRKL